MKFKSNKEENHNKVACQSGHCCHYLSSSLNYQCSMLETRKLKHPQTTRDIHSLCHPLHKVQTLWNDEICKYHTSNPNTIQSQSLSLLQSRGTPQSSPKKKSKRISIEKCTECLSNRSCSREKFLESRIDQMLKQQQQKFILLSGNPGNRINFLNNKSFLQNELMMRRDKEEKSKQSKKKIKRQINTKCNQKQIEKMKFDINVSQLNEYMLSQEKDKQNQYNLNKLDQKAERLHTQKSNKLTLRNYINTTPALTESLVNSFDNNIVKSNENSDKYDRNANDESRIQSQRDRLTPLKNINIKNNQVLKQVRQIKGMFLELLNKKEESKTKKKCYNFMKSENEQSKQAFTFHD